MPRFRSPLSLALLLAAILAILYFSLGSSNGDAFNSTSAFSSGAGSQSSKIIQLSMLTDNVTDPELHGKCLQSHIAHGEKWGHETHVLRRSLLGEQVDEDIHFSKELFIQGWMVQELAKPVEERAEWIFWFDADSLILNPHVPLSLFLPPSSLTAPTPHLLATKDHAGLNTGHFFLRIHPWSAQLLSSILATPSLLPHPASSSDELSTNTADHTALANLLSGTGGATHDRLSDDTITNGKTGKWRHHTLYLPIEWFNQFDISLGDLPGPEPGTLLLHFVDKRRDVPTAMTAWLARLKSAAREFQPQLSDTTYEEQVQVFWEDVQAGREALRKAEALMAGMPGGSKGHTKGEDGEPYEQAKRMDEVRKRIKTLRTVLEEKAYAKEEVENGRQKLEVAVLAARKPAIDPIDEESKGPEVEEQDEKSEGEKVEVKGELDSEDGRPDAEPGQPPADS